MNVLLNLILCLILTICIPYSSIDAQSNHCCTINHGRGELLHPNFYKSNVILTKKNHKGKGFADITKLMPPAVNQDNTPLCWAFATTYSLISYLKNTTKQENFFDDSINDSLKMSPGFLVQLVYREKNETCPAKFNAKDALDTIRKHGSVSLKDMNYSSFTHCRDTDYIKHLKNKSTIYSPPFYANSTKNLDVVKNALDEKKPVLLAIKLDCNFYKICNNIKGEYDPKWDSFVPTDTCEHHAMTIVGYNDSLQLVKAMNSWGQDWGNNGYVWISYSVLEKHIDYYCYLDTILKHSIESADRPQSQPISISLNTMRLSNENWVKRGYYRTYNKFRVGVSYLSKETQKAQIQIRDDSTEKLIYEFYAEVGSSYEFFIDEIKYRLDFENIEHRGWFVNIFNWYAMIYTLTYLGRDI